MKHSIKLKVCQNYEFIRKETLRCNVQKLQRYFKKTENRNTLRKLCLLENSIFKYRKEEEDATRIYDAIKFANERNENNSDSRDFLRRKTLLLNAAERYREIYRYNFNSEILN